MDNLLDDDTGLVSFCLEPESNEKSNNVSDKSSEGDKNKESDKRYI